MHDGQNLGQNLGPLPWPKLPPPKGERGEFWPIVARGPELARMSSVQFCPIVPFVLVNVTHLEREHA